MNTRAFHVPLLFAIGSLIMACSSSRDVEVEGQVSQAADVASEGKIVMSFYDVVSEDEVSKVGDFELASPGAFKKTLSLEGETVRIIAVRDVNGDGACSAGEAWASLDAKIEDDQVSGAELRLTNAPCPEMK